jgi:hypothetical protein
MFLIPKFAHINMVRRYIKNRKQAGCWWLTPVILTTQEAEIRKIAVQSQPWSNSSQDSISIKLFPKKGLVQWLKVKALSSSLSTTHTHTHKEQETIYVTNNVPKNFSDKTATEGTNEMW